MGFNGRGGGARGRGGRGRGGTKADAAAGRAAEAPRGHSGGRVGHNGDRGKGGVASGSMGKGPTDNHVVAGCGSTRMDADVLRAFSTPEWWLIGSSDSATELETAAGTRRRYEKPEHFQKHCSEKHAEMVSIYESMVLQDSEQRWLRKVSSEGTMGDRVASLTMLIQVCPVLSTGYLKALLAMASKLARGDVAMVVDALKDLFIGTLLPNRKLKTLGQMEPLSEKLMGKAAFTIRCAVAFFEDYLKTAFAAFIQVLSEAAHSTVVFFKLKAIRTVHDLLIAKPEQERALLSLLVNKFGDLAAKVSSLVSQCLKKLEQSHPGMKSVIVKEVESFLSRSNITPKSQYHALLHLTEMVLSRRPEDAQLAAQLVRLYVIRLQKALLPPEMTKRKAVGKIRRKRNSIKKRRGHLHEDDNRLIRTLINGIQRALPYVEAGLVAGSPLEKDTVDALFKVCHTVSAFSTRIAILSLLFRCLFSKSDPPDRFYRLLYEQLVQFDLFACAHRFQAFNLVRRCVPADVSLPRAVAVGRRLLQVGACAEPAVAVAGLVITRDLLQANRTEMKTLLGTVDKDVGRAPDGYDDVEEVFFDDDSPAARGAGARAGGVDAGGRAAKTAAGAAEQRERYDPSARDPRHARGRNAPLWELHALAQHVHPFVAEGASRLLVAETFQDAGDNPFEDFSYNELLEQFAYVSRARKARLSTGISGKRGDSASRATYNTERFANRKNVLPHERFFQMYFRDSIVRKTLKRKAKARQQREEEVDEEQQDPALAKDDDQDEEEDQFFDNYLEGQIPKDDGGDSGDDSDGPDVDDDFDMSDEGEDVASDEGEEGSGGDSDGSDASGSEGSMSGGDGGRPESIKRKAADAGLPATAARKERVKALKKKHSGAMFASAEDFEQLIAEDAS